MNDTKRDERCPECMGLNGSHNTLHVRFGNGAGGNMPCPRDESANNTTRDELVGLVEAVTGYTRGKGGWEMDVSHTDKVYADIDGLIAGIEAARDAEIRELLLTYADGYIVAKGQDGEAEAAFATKPWMEQILAAIGLHGDETGGQE